jgi:hypothetical protein
MRNTVFTTRPAIGSGSAMRWTTSARDARTTRTSVPPEPPQRSWEIASRELLYQQVRQVSPRVSGRVVAVLPIDRERKHLVVRRGTHRSPRAGGTGLAHTPDCERVRDHGIAQPVNTITSAAYGVASLPVLIVARRSTGLLRMELHAYAGALVAVMAGSAQFHARGPGPSHRLHDGSLYAAISLGSLLLLPVAETLAGTRVGRRLVLAAATAGAAYACGRSSSRFCRPDSLWQFHALWHVLSAGAAALVAFVATDGRHEQRHSGASPRLVTGFHVAAALSRVCQSVCRPNPSTVVRGSPRKS